MVEFDYLIEDIERGDDLGKGVVIAAQRGEIVFHHRAGDFSHSTAPGDGDIRIGEIFQKTGQLRPGLSDPFGQGLHLSSLQGI